MDNSNKNVKILAFYLPQFHTIPENDKWWGKGFTEWTNVKKATPLYKGHNQPRIPLKQNYYNLLDIETIRWQAKIAKEYHINGFCFYHYYFNGKHLLEKPIELLYENKDIDIEYCLSWANEPWSRAWDGKGKEILIDQHYGGEEIWTNQFFYFLKYFKDSRYIQKDNKPVLIIYRANSINDFDAMISFWDVLAKNNGFDGLYVIESLTAFQKTKHSELSNATLLFEPSYTKSNFGKGYKIFKKTINIFFPAVVFDSYDLIWKKIIRRKVDTSNVINPGAFVDWDNSPRRKQGAHVIYNTSVEKFKKYFAIQYSRAIYTYRSDYLFINAWNEWAEGAYLEPDKKNEFGYLESVRQIVESIHLE